MIERLITREQVEQRRHEEPGWDESWFQGYMQAYDEILALFDEEESDGK